jgi:preprotein translocase subunit SecG
MMTFFYIIQFIIAFGLILIIMFQKSEGGTGLISSNQYNSFFSSRGLVSNPLTRVTIILGILFFINSIIIGGLHLAQNKSSDDLINKIEAIQQDKSKEKEATKNKEVPLGK